MITSGTASLGRRRDGCHWSGTASFNRFRHDNGAREWNAIRRADRRRTRHHARRALHAHLPED